MLPAPCTCNPGTEADGWHEQRSPECEAYEREQAQAGFRAYFEEVASYPGDFRTAVQAWSRAMNARRQWALYDYLGMQRARR